MTAECANQLKTTSADNQGKHSLTTLSRLTGYRIIASLAHFHSPDDSQTAHTFSPISDFGDGTIDQLFLVAR
jgi:hypothetical protein